MLHPLGTADGTNHRQEAASPPPPPSPPAAPRMCHRDVRESWATITPLSASSLAAHQQQHHQQAGGGGHHSSQEGAMHAFSPSTPGSALQSRSAPGGVSAFSGSGGGSSAPTSPHLGPTPPPAVPAAAATAGPPTIVIGPQGRFGHTAIVVRGKMIIFGGRTQEYFNDLWAFDLCTRSWELIEPCPGPKPPPRAGHTCVVSPSGDELYIYGGATSHHECAGDEWVFHLNEHRWEFLSPQSTTGVTNNGVAEHPGARRGHTALIYNNAIWLFGGSPVLGTPGLADNHLWRRSLPGGRWQSVPVEGEAPCKRLYHVAEVDDARGIMLVFGGRNIDAHVEYFEDLFAFDLNSNTCTKLVPLNSGRGPCPRMCSASFFHNGVLCVFLGGSATYHSDNFEFDLQANEWRPILTGPVARARPTTILADNTVTLFGGCDRDSAFLNDVVQLSLEAPSLLERCRDWISHSFLLAAIAHAQEQVNAQRQAGRRHRSASMGDGGGGGGNSGSRRRSPPPVFLTLPSPMDPYEGDRAATTTTTMPPPRRLLLPGPPSPSLPQQGTSDAAPPPPPTATLPPPPEADGGRHDGGVIFAPGLPRTILDYIISKQR